MRKQNWSQLVEDLRSPKVFEKLISLLPDSNLHVKVATIAALGFLGDKRAIDPLQKMLKKASETICFSIQFALERLMREKGAEG